MSSSYPESLVPRGVPVPRPPAPEPLDPRYGPSRPPPGPPPWGGGPPGPPPGGGGPRRGVVVAVAVLAALAVLASGAGIGWGLSHVLPGVLQGRLTPNQPSAGGGTNGRIDVQGVADRVNPAIVDINTEIGAGTGMLVTPSGEVLTNNHVIEGASRIQVSVEGRGNRLPATVMGEDPTHDVALVKLQGVSGLPTVNLAGPNAAKVGQQVVAIGNAGGEGGPPEVTQGTVTGLDKSITARDPSGGSERLTGLLQTNAPIVEGDSGGALVDGSAKVLGMITAGGSDRGPSSSSRASRVGFAIPASTANGIVKQIETGKATDSVIIGLPGYLGVQVQTLSPEIATRLGLSVNSGAFVARVVDGSPASALGIGQQSVITAINGGSVDSADALGAALHKLKPGQQVRVTWVDEAGSHSGTATLSSGPAA
ncbi:MAG TPA: trypsin-like peptidase domain-containing protein [Candidatus Binatia bacterium]|nr:trypsin-like peptidase domain-containing protein [Candidatus Binatia bacterium]